MWFRIVCPVLHNDKLHELTLQRRELENNRVRLQGVHQGLLDGIKHQRAEIAGAQDRLNRATSDLLADQENLQRRVVAAETTSEELAHLARVNFSYQVRYGSDLSLAVFEVQHWPMACK